ncbi:MAG: enoyl-CoA hydratase/isomerase family protein, partial [Thermoplasmatota archaeon]
MVQAGYQNVIIEKHGPVAVLKVNRPEALNALNEQVLGELAEAVSELETDRSISVVVFTGEGKSFIAGADIKLMVNLTPLEAKVFAEN